MDFVSVVIEADPFLPSSDVNLLVSKLFLDEIDIGLCARLLAIKAGSVR